MKSEKDIPLIKVNEYYPLTQPTKVGQVIFNDDAFSHIFPSFLFFFSLVSGPLLNDGLTRLSIDKCKKKCR